MIHPAPKPKPRPKKARKPIQRSRVRQKRATPRRQANRDLGLLAWVAQQACWATGRKSGDVWKKAYDDWRGTTIDVAHVRTKRLGGDRNNVIPLAHSVHMRQHQIGIQSWLREIGRTRAELDQAAVEYTERYDRERSVG